MHDDADQVGARGDNHAIGGSRITRNVRGSRAAEQRMYLLLTLRSKLTARQHGFWGLQELDWNGGRRERKSWGRAQGFIHTHTHTHARDLGWHGKGGGGEFENPSP